MKISEMRDEGLRKLSRQSLVLKTRGCIGLSVDISVSRGGLTEPEEVTLAYELITCPRRGERTSRRETKKN